MMEGEVKPPVVDAVNTSMLVEVEDKPLVIDGIATNTIVDVEMKLYTTLKVMEAEREPVIEADTAITVFEQN